MRTAALIVLLLGVSVGLAIYVAAEDALADPAISEMLLSKQHNRAIERLGGKAMKLFVELDEWFRGLWHGKQLGKTIMFLSVSVGAALYFASRRENRR